MAWRWTALQPAGTAPAPRAGFASAVIDGSLFVAGGWDGQTAFEDAFALDLASLRWRTLSLRGEATFARRIMFGHAAAEDGRHLYVHGGTDPQNLNTIRGDLFAFDVIRGTLKNIPLSGDGPPALSRHSVAAMQGSLWVFGGWDGRAKLDGAYRLRLTGSETNEDRRPSAARWERLLPSGFVPYPRSDACLLPTPRLWWPNLLLFGGGDGDFDFGDLYVLHTETGYWQRLHNVSSDSPGLSQAGCALLGTPLGASAVLAVHGGYGGPAERPKDSKRQDALRLLTLGSRQPQSVELLPLTPWASPRAVRAPALARMGHAVHAVNESCLLVFGGNGEREEGFGARYLNDVALAVPNRLHARGAKDESPTDPPTDDDDLPHSEEVIRTVRIADRHKRRRRKKKSSRAPRSNELKEEL